MANPMIVNLKADSWMRVARGVTSGVVKKIETEDAAYWETFRIYGDPKPTGDSDGVNCFINNNFEIISSTEKIDVYMKCDKDSRVRVDLP